MVETGVKFQDTCFCCLRDLERQILHEIGNRMISTCTRLALQKNLTNVRNLILPLLASLTRPYPPPDLSRLPVLPACASFSRATPLQTLRGASAVFVLLQRLYVWHASQNGTPPNILNTPPNMVPTSPNILSTPSKILHTLSNILSSLSKILCILFNILGALSNIQCIPSILRYYYPLQYFTCNHEAQNIASAPIFST